MSNAKRNRILIGVGFVALIVFIMYSTMGLAKVTCEVCVAFQGQTICRSAAGTERNEAIATAHRTACAELASGREDSIRCTEMTAPQKTTCNQ